MFYYEQKEKQIFCNAKKKNGCFWRKLQLSQVYTERRKDKKVVSAFLFPKTSFNILELI